MVRKYWIFLISLITIIIILTLSIIFLKLKPKNISLLSPISVQKTLEKYSFDNLRQREFTGGSIIFGRVIKEEETYTSRMFYFYSDGKRLSGLFNIPKKSTKLPVIIMFRGYVDQEIYTTGEGTRRAGEVFAANGFLTLAPDFLGYGESDKPSDNPVEERFENYTAALNLLASIKSLETAGTEKVGIWGHSNGGQIALSVLAITGKSYPTVLWAPVTKPFPYSVLYYTDEFEDHGKKLRKVISDFEKDYDVEKYTFTNYLELITAPIELHQGGVDDAVPQKWSDQYVAEMRKLEKEITYYTYPADDHNFGQGNWNTVVQRNIAFFRKNLKSTSL